MSDTALCYGVVYLLTNVETGQCYVGKTTKTLRNRWQVHQSEARRRPQQYLHKAISKHGAHLFAQQIVAVAHSSEQLDCLEKLWIFTLRTTDRRYGYNLTFGGDGYVPTEETREKVRFAATGRVFSATHRANISKAGKGRKFSAIHRARISAANKGTLPSAFCRQRVGEANSTRKHSESTRAKLSVAAQKANQVRWHQHK